MEGWFLRIYGNRWVQKQGQSQQNTEKKAFIFKNGMGHRLEKKRNKENSVLPRWKISPSFTQYRDSGHDWKSNCSPKKCYYLLPENCQISVQVYNVSEGICTIWECGVYLWDEKERVKRRNWISNLERVQLDVLWRKIPKGKEEMNGVKQHTGMASVFSRNEYWDKQEGNTEAGSDY